MRIAFFTDTYTPQINGLSTTIDLYSKYLRKEGHDLYIFAPAVPGYEDEEEFVHRFKSVEFPTYREYRLAIPYKTLLRPALRRLKCDIINIHSPFSIGLMGLAIAKKNKIPCVGTFHTLYPEYIHYASNSGLIKHEKVSSSLKKGMWKYLKWFYRQCDVVIALSEESEELIKKHGIKNTVLLPTGIDMKERINRNKKSKTALKKKYGFPNKKVVLHVGRITKEKNIEFLVRSLKNILSDDNMILVITSDGPYKVHIENLCKKLSIQNNVVFTGYISKKELADYYSLADVFVMTSKTETQGIVLFEAMKYTLPVVVLDSPVIGTFVKKNKIGVVASKNNFPRSVEKILHNTATSRKFSTTERKIMKEYDIKKSVRKMVDLYNSIIPNNPLYSHS